MVTKDELLYARSRYYGEVNPENLVFNASFQEFSQRVGYVVNLETNGKMSAEESYEHIEILWAQFELACQQLKIVA